MELRKELVMLVDSSDNLRFVLKDFLELSGYTVVDFKDGVSASEHFNKGIYNICIIDVAMKNCDGFNFLQKIRQIDKAVPIIVLSSLSDKADRIRCFNLGCDDYVTKPFSIEELGLRIQAILRRCRNSKVRVYDASDVVIKFGEFSLDYNEMQLVHPKKTRFLTRKECDLLKLLLDHKNKLVPREIIMREIWGEEDNTNSRSMDVFMTKLRSYLQVGNEDFILPRGSNKRKVQYSEGFVPNVEIINIHGTGFMLKVREDEQK